MELSFLVEGRPQTAGSKVAMPRKGGKPLVVESGDRKAKTAFRDDLRAAAREAIRAAARETYWPYGGPCQVVFTFMRRRPQSHYGRRSGAAYVKATAPAFPITRPDALKLARHAEDSLTSILWHDDAAIVDERLLKVWAPREGVRVMVRQLDAVTPPMPIDIGVLALPLAR